jgi:hypothetical protein
MRGSTLQRMDEELRVLLRRMYPKKTMPEATRLLAKDLWNEVMNGKKFKKKFRESLK